MKKKRIIVGVILAVILLGVINLFTLVLPEVKEIKDETWEEELIEAVKKDDINKVEKLLNEDFFGMNYDYDINQRQKQSQIPDLFSECPVELPLVCACENASYEMAKLLIENGADVNYVPYGQATSLETLLKSFNYNTRKDYHDVYPILELLISKNLDKSTEMKRGDSPSKVAAGLLPFSKNEEYVEEDGEYWDIYDEERAEEALKIYKRVSGWTTVEQEDYELLQTAASYSNIKVLEYMLKEQKLDANSTDRYGRTVLFHSLPCDTKEEKEMARKIISLFKQYGFDMEKKDKEGMTAVEYARAIGSQRWAELLAE